MRIFLTGGTGFLGGKVIKRLLSDDNELYILARNPEKIKMNDKRVNLIKGSLENISEWQSSLAGMDIVIHMAAPVVFWDKWEMYQKSIVDATSSVLKAAEQNGVGKFIYISSESVLEDKNSLIEIDESTPYPKEPNSFYGKSKMLAEKNILKSSSKIKKIIIRPTFIWGKDAPQLQSIVDKVKAGQFMWIDHGNIMVEMVHVENVAEAIALSCYKGKDNDIFYVTDDNPKLAKEFFTDLMATQGISIPDKSIPGGVARPLAAFVEFIWKTCRLKSYPPLDRFDLAFIAMPRLYKIDKIKKDLGYKPVVGYKEGLEEMYR